MYTGQVRRGRNSLQRSEEPTFLGNAVAAAVHGQTRRLLQLTIEYFRWDGMKDISSLAELLLRALGEIHIQGEPTDQQNEMISRASNELRKGHRQFRAATTWLCSPKRSGPAAPVNLKLVASGKWEPGRYPHVEKEDENFIRYYEGHALRHFRSRLSLQDGRLLPLPRIVHYVDVFCAYILDRCVGRKASEMPIKICPRCRELFLSKRKQFCSKTCQWKHYWTPERRSDDKWIKDLEKFSQSCRPKYGRSVADLQKRLGLPKVKQRLKSIKEKIETEDWAGWRKIAKRLETIEKLGRD